MKNLLVIIAMFCVSSANAQDYLITFTGSGESTTVDSVRVENLTQVTNLSVDGSNVLHLVSTVTGIESLIHPIRNPLWIYPNPMTDYTNLQFNLHDQGKTVISIQDISGRLIFQAQDYLSADNHTYQIVGLEKGLYIVTVRSEGTIETGNLISYGPGAGNPKIQHINTLRSQEVIPEEDAVAEKKEDPTKRTTGEVQMQYTTGDKLKLTGISGDYSTVIIDVPTESKAITFNFIACTDGDKNSYQTIRIGDQLWMAENLKTTKFRNGTPIPTETINDAWRKLVTPAYCWCNNNEAEYKATYGALYNWYAASSGNLCPTGWHVPADAEWTNLTNYLTQNGYGYPDGADQIAKSMAATWGWKTYTEAGTPGNDQLSNNNSGFTALPAGYRADGGVFVSHGLHGFFWSSEEFWSGEARGLGVSYFSSTAYRSRFYNHYGFSVRCLLD